MSLNKQPPSRSSLGEVIAYTENMIQEAERRLLDMQVEFTKPEAANVAQISGQMVMAAKWLTRRRTLIEVWEHATNQVWQSRLVNPK